MKATARGFTSERLSGYVFIAPAVVLFAIFQIYPLFRTAALSVQEFVGSSFAPVGLKNYAELFASRVFAKSLVNSALFVAINMPLILVFTLLGPLPILWRLLSRILLIPVLAGIALGLLPSDAAYMALAFGLATLLSVTALATGTPSPVGRAVLNHVVAITFGLLLPLLVAA